METNLDKRYQTQVVLWFALLLSIGSLLVVAALLAPELGNQPRQPSGFIEIVALTAPGILLVILSIVVRKTLLARSIEKQDVSLVQTSLVIACALCEASALLGLIEFFVIGYREYYLLFLFAAAGIAFHFPRRGQLESASYKNTTNIS